MDHRTLRGIHLIRVRGNQSQRLKEHAVLLRKEIPNGALEAVIRKNEWLVRRSTGVIQFPPLCEAVIRAYRKILLPLLGRNLKPEEREAIRVAAAELGLTYEMGREMMFQADAMMLLVRTSVMKHLLPEWIPGALPGCSSGVVQNDWTKDGRLLVSRNLDYPIVGAWEKNPTVVFNEPTDSGEVPYVSIGSAGVPAGGITSMNREGLTLSTHAHFGKEVSLRGRPVVVIGDEIIRKAKNLNEAIDLARKSQTCANWSFVIASAKENDAVVIEKTPSQTRIRGMADGLLVHTNYFHSPDLQRQEALLSGTYCEDLKGRFCRMRQILEKDRGSLEPSHLASALGDHMDCYVDQERVVGNTLSVITTVNSVVFDPGNQKFWMADRKESPVGLGEFVEIDVERFWKEDPEEYKRNLKVLPGYQPKTQGLLEGVHHYREAYRAFHMNNQESDYRQRAFDSLCRAVSAYPSDGHLWVQAGIMAFKLREFQKAQKYLEGSCSRVLSNHVSSVRDLYLARCLDLSGSRKKALELYRTYDQVHEPKLKKALKRGLKRRYRAIETASVMVDLHFPDTFQY